jgi:glucose-6-phosphate isomerase
MQLPDEAVDYVYQGALASPTDAWTPLAEFQQKHLLAPARVRGLVPLMMQVRGQVAAERDLQQPPPEMQPLLPGFIDLPQKLLDGHRRKGEASELGRILSVAARLREQVDRVVVLGIGGSYLAPRAFFEALCHSYHNELPPRTRMGKPRVYFDGNNADNDGLQDLLELLENTCVDPELQEERWGIIVSSKSGSTLETAAVYRVVRAELGRFYGNNSPRLKELIVPITAPTGRLRELCKADGFKDEQILTIPDNVGGRYSAFTAAGLLPAAVMGLDVRAILLGAAAMTRRFLEEGFEKNPVLQFATVNYLMTEELQKRTRVMAVWSRKLEALGQWYDQLLAESLGKTGRGPTPLTLVHTRDLHSRGQLLQEGPRDTMLNNLLVKATHHPPIQIGMADRNEDDLNQFSRRHLPDIVTSTHQGMVQAFQEVARPTADIVLPALSEHTIGQLMQMLMLSTVVEARLMGLNPYNQPGIDPYKKHMYRILRETKSNPQV